MKPHVTEWIPAYYDGELRGARLGQVEAHLEGCTDCRAELEQLRRLSVLLGEAAEVPARLEPGVFTAQVNARLTPPAARPGWQRALKTGWQVAPLGLVLVWAFCQAVLLLTPIMLFAGAGRYLPDVRLSTFGFLGVLLDLLSGGWLERAVESLPWQAPFEPLFFFGIVNIGLTLAVGIFLWGWTASWWIYSRRQASPAHSMEGG